MWSGVRALPTPAGRSQVEVLLSPGFQWNTRLEQEQFILAGHTLHFGECESLPKAGKVKCLANQQPSKTNSEGDVRALGGLGVGRDLNILGNFLKYFYC